MVCVAAAVAMRELDDMSNQEREVRYLHVFQFISQQLADFLVGDTGKSSSTNSDYAAIKCAMIIARRLRTAMETANEALKKSPIASLLPPLEFREKLIVAAAKQIRKFFLDINSLALL